MDSNRFQESRAGWTYNDQMAQNPQNGQSLEIESENQDKKPDEMVKTEISDLFDSSRRTSFTFSGRGDEDGDRTAVNSRLNSSANSSTHLPLDQNKMGMVGNVRGPDASPEEPYHIFSKYKKKYLVYVVSLAALFSPLSSNIYFPALGRIAKDLKVSNAAVNLSITIYMIVQALAPSFWGPFSDTIGRRPIFLGTMTVYLISNIGLALSDNYVGLMVFRGIQAAGSAATISIGAGVISDVATADERGGMMGTFGGIRMMGQAIGPVIGGLITQLFGYKGIFWFLLILGSISVFLIMALLPETLRPIAGNGTTRLVGFQKPLIYYIKSQPNVQHEQDPDAPKRKVTIGAMFSPLRFLTEKDVFITLFFGSIVYTVWSMVTSSTTSLFQDKFGISDFQVGLAFLPNGIGCVAGSTLTGKLMNWDFKRTEREYRAAKNIPEDVKLNSKVLDDFPIEKARMRNIWWLVLIFVTTTVAYGFSFRIKNIAAPLVLQFFIAYTATAVFSLNSTLVVDLYPGKGASATAVNNLMRCSVGAAGVAVVELIIEAIGEDKTFLILGLATLVASPLLVVQMMYGMKWRGERADRVRKKEAAKEAVLAEKGKLSELERKVEELEKRMRGMETTRD